MGLKPRLAPKRNCIKDEATEARQTLRLDMALCIWRFVHGAWPLGSLSGGARRDRTDDLMLAKHALSQLSYGPFPRGKARMANLRMRCQATALEWRNGGPGKT